MDVTGFDWDHANCGKCQKHGVPVLVIEAVLRGKIDVFPDPVHSRNEERYIAIGRSGENRMVFVAFTLRRKGPELFVRPVSARYMHRKEIAYYEKETTKIQNR